MSVTLLGIRLDGERFLHWRMEVLKKSKTTCGRPSGKYRRALDAFEHLRDAIANCFTIDKLIKEGEKYGLSEEETVLELLWMLWSSECTPPVAMFFGVARKDFVLQSKSGNFQIHQDERLIGNCHIAQRDSEHFTVPGCKSPDEFDPKRFEVQPDLKRKSIDICAHGLIDEKPSGDNHKCAGTHLGIITIKAFVMYLALFCDWELIEKPYWTRKTLIRYGNPDEPIRLKQFRYKRDIEELPIPDELESSSDISDHLDRSYDQDATRPGCPWDH